MKHTLGEPSRSFSPLPGIQLKDMGTIELLPDEQVTLALESGKKNDIVRKDWGVYLGNSLNANLSSQGFKTALVLSHASNPPRLFLNLVEQEKMGVFEQYLKDVNAEVVSWLDEWPAMRTSAGGR